MKATYRVTRREAVSRAPAEREGGRASRAAYLEAEPPRAADAPREGALARSSRPERPTPSTKARAFYDYLVDNGTYDKTAPGWGKGDSERFCDVKKGQLHGFPLGVHGARARRRGFRCASSSASR